MKQLIYRNRFFIIPLFIFWITGLISILSWGKAGLHILLNKLNSPLGDIFFQQVTNLGNGILYIPLLFILVLISYRKAVIFTTGVIISNILLYIGKHFLFKTSCRPAKYFELYENYQLHFVEGVKIHYLHSFPSGHTTTVFTLFFMLCLLTRNNMLKIFYFIVAFLTGYSRIYLSQHFMVDVIAGSFLGTGGIIIACFYFESRKNSGLYKSIKAVQKKRRKANIPKLAPR